jgi:biopolymer transport protein ExbD
MGMASAASKGGVKNDINITPLVDVVLVLLIIFMVVTPLLQRGRDVHLPKVKQPADDKKQADPLVLSITPDRKIYVETAQYGDDEIEPRIAREISADPNKRVLLKGDESVTVGDVRKLMEHSKKAGAKAVQLAVEEIKKK